MVSDFYTGEKESRGVTFDSSQIIKQTENRLKDELNLLKALISESIVTGSYGKIKSKLY